MKKLLSHHEIAMLFVLFSASGQVALADPDVVTLQQEQLVEVVSTTSEGGEFRLTSEGTEVLRRLGLARM
ncbi:hypothetical protein [Paraburkholderia fungorum]|jgi:hypothetical protein|uniref:hypothetical protein n=1 Tax=Paraburkholderia fungorum TaxID=134537 RepID=UPI0015B54C2A|nr:hypothetical protein [Paraburkholderia fungorum]QLD53949.1 hypothetical protein C9419_33255 [Paraburkholderia fungorum]